MKKKLILVAPLLLSLFMASCGTSNSGSVASISNKEGNTSEKQTVLYTVTFANTSLASIQIEAGKALSKPADPVKANSIFTGWYLDSNLTQLVSFPLVINNDTTIYAGFYSYQEAFQKARNNTIGKDIAGYEYDYTLHVSAGYMGLALNGNATGNSKYNSKTSDVSFYDVHVNSGSLFYDGSKHTIKKSRELHEISLDENDIVKDYDIKEVGEEYKYDSSAFAKALFEYDETKLKEIKPTNVANEYELKTGFNFSQGLSLVGNYVNHPMVEKLIGELPETNVDTGMYVTFSNDKLNTYRYEMLIDVTGIQFTLTYSLTFKNVGVAPTITPKIFDNTYVTNSDVSKIKNEINGYINSYKALELSSYDFKVKTAVDYPKKNAINATIDGFTKRKVSNGIVYYLNDYEVDTDHKNADLYKALGLDDCHGGRAKLSNGEIHDLKKKVLGGYSDIATVTNSTSDDDYYLLDTLSMIQNVSFVQKMTDTKKNKITYAIGANTVDCVNVLKNFNSLLRF